MNLIVAVDNQWGIGYNGKLLVSIPEDMKFFRQMTTGKTVVYGRKTLQTFPQGKPLPNRRNIVLTHQEDFEAGDATVVHSSDEMALCIKDIPSDEVFCIGGASIYKELLPLCDTAYVTHIDYRYACDTYFPNLDQDSEWEKVEEGEEKTYFDIIYSFDVYKRKK